MMHLSTTCQGKNNDVLFGLFQMFSSSEA